MRVVTATTPHALAVEEREAVEPGPGEVRVDVQACGICGSDLHLLHLGLAPGHVPGHEIAGIVAATGPGVEALAPGTSVAVEPLASCGTCAACLAGQPLWCREIRLFGVHLPGGMADSIVVPAERAHPVDPTLAPAVAALVEPVAVGVHACDRVALEPGERVLVLGAGTIGLLAVRAALEAGAGEVWITARHAHQAERARDLGAHRVLDAREADARFLDRLGREDDIDVVIETVGGAADTLGLALTAIRPGGRIAVLGLFDGAQRIDPWVALAKEASFVWSNCYAHPAGAPPDFERAARLVEGERELLASLCTHSLPLEDAARAFEIAGDKSSGAIKVTLEP